MQISLSFICQNVPDTRLYQCNSLGEMYEEKAFSITYGILPIVCDAYEVVDGSTFWLLSSCKDYKASIDQAIAQDTRLIICTEDGFSYIQQLPLEKRAYLDVLVLKDPDDALLTVARAWRTHNAIPTLAITGSIGKSATKGMLQHIFKQEGIPVYASQGKCLSLQTLALSMLHVTTAHVLSFFEIHAHHPGSLTPLVTFLQPTMGLITNISNNCIDNFHSIHTISHEMRTLFASFSPGQIGIINGDDPNLAPYAYSVPIVRFGTKVKNQIRASKVTPLINELGIPEMRCIFRIYDKQKRITLQGNHRGLVYAALAAASACYFLNTPFEAIVEGLESFTATPGCFQPLPLAAQPGEGLVINDASTVSPEGMKAAIAAMHITTNFKHKIAVLGDMIGLGDKAGFWHRQIGRDLNKARSIKEVILVGDSAKRIGETTPSTIGLHYARDWQDAREATESLILPTRKNLVLVNGQDTQLSSLVDALTLTKGA